MSSNQIRLNFWERDFKLNASQIFKSCEQTISLSSLIECDHIPTKYVEHKHIMNINYVVCDQI